MTRKLLIKYDIKIFKPFELLPELFRINNVFQIEHLKKILFQVEISRKFLTHLRQFIIRKKANIYSNLDSPVHFKSILFLNLPNHPMIQFLENSSNDDALVDLISNFMLQMCLWSNIKC